jgi:competence protein ComEA
LPAQIVIVTGAVRRPGVYPLRPGERVARVIARAGGFASGAARDQVRLSERVRNGQQVHVPSRLDTANSGGDPAPLLAAPPQRRPASDSPATSRIAAAATAPAPAQSTPNSDDPSARGAAATMTCRSRRQGP